jgi:hypothetical protein
VDTLQEFRARYLAELSIHSNGTPFVVDKMPHNFLYISLIIKAFPEAKIIHVKRDPSATCWSNFKHYFPAKGLGYSYDLIDTKNYFNLYADLMRFWDKQYESKIYQLDYEKLVINTEHETQKMIKFLGLDWEQSCLLHHKNRTNIKTASQQQVKKKIYTGSSQAWRQFEPYLQGILS